MAEHAFAPRVARTTETATTWLPVSKPTDRHEREADRVVASWSFANLVPSPPRPAADRIRPLAAAERTFFEPRLSTSLGGVRVHTGPAAERAAAGVDAAAFTVGDDVVLGAPGPEPGPLLAHELVHVAQQRTGAIGRGIHRQPANATSEFDAERVAAGSRAVSFMQTLARNLAVDRALAQRATVPAAGQTPIQAAEAALARINQATIQQRLQHARTVFRSQMASLPADDPVTGELRVAFTEFLHEVRLSMDAALQCSTMLSNAVQVREHNAYEDTIAFWLQASPFSETSLGRRSRFTAAELAASQTWQADLEAFVGSVEPTRLLVDSVPTTGPPVSPLSHRINAASPQVAGAALEALGQRQQPLERDASGRIVRGNLASAQTEAMDLARDQIARNQRIIARALTVVDAAIGELGGWLRRPHPEAGLRWPGQPAPAPSRVPAILRNLYDTEDPAYGRVLLQRMGVIRDALGGQGGVRVTLQSADSGECQDPNVLAHAAPGALWLCLRDRGLAETAFDLLHEAGHALIPQVGARPLGTDRRLSDRAEPGERLLTPGFMSTEEALMNAESLARLVVALGDPSITIRASTTDEVTGGTQEQGRTVRIAVGRVEAWARNAGIMPTLAAQIAGQLWPSDDNDAVLAAFPGTTAQVAGRLSLGQHFTLETDPARCPPGAVATADGWAVRADGTAVQTRSATSVTFCPGYLSLPDDERDRVAFVALALRRTTSAADARLLARVAMLAQRLYDRIAGERPTGSRLEQHQRHENIWWRATHPSGEP